MEDLDQGEIYLVINKTNGKKYVGQAMKYVTIKNIKWGTIGRWNSHVREATSGSKDHCVLLNQAIRKYGKDNFDVTKLCDCLLIEMNELEQMYMNVHSSRAPNGYNLREGGSNGKASQESIERMKASRTGLKHNEKGKANISKGQLGNRRGVKVRKYEEDKELPKYISALRKGGTIYGYCVGKYPIGTTSKEYINRQFRIYKNGTKEDALQRALAYLDELKEKYKDLQEKVQEVKDKNEENDIDEKMTNKKSAKLPNHITAIIKRKKLAGYYTDGLTGHDGTVIPRKDFSQHAMKHNLRQAMQYIMDIGKLNDNRAKINDWSKIDVATKTNKYGTHGRYLPKYVIVVRSREEVIGYGVNGLPYTDETGSKKHHRKMFAKSTLSLDEKYKMALAHLDQMKVKFNITN